MQRHSSRRAVSLAAVITAFAMVAMTGLTGTAANRTATNRRSRASGLSRLAEDQLASIVAQKEGDEEGRFEIEEAAAQFAEPRTGPPGALTAARDDAAAIATASGTWVQVTNLPYDSDDPNYRDPFISNSGGGSGLVAGRAAAVAVDGSWVYAGGADGGLWRSRDAGGTWQPMTDDLDSTSSGAIGVNPKDHSVWYATGESSTAFENYLGTGVYVSYDHAATWSKVGGDELDGQMSAAIVFDGHGHVVVGTSAGIVRRSLSAPLGDPWTVVARPGTPGPYGFTYVNDVQVDPTDGMHMVASIAWRGGPTDYNGFYESTNGGASWSMVDPDGINGAQIGKSSFAFGSDGRLYSLVESIHKYLFNPETVLMGVYESRSGHVAGPWDRIATSKQLGNSPNSALGFGSGYSPGIQAWYNQALGVAPNNPNRVFVGMEEVYETRNQGDAWTTIGPYWNFGLPCGANDLDDCPKTTHPDQHGIAFGQGKLWMANDGGIYSRSLAKAKKWINNNADLRMLQYYYGGTGKVPGGTAYWGGLQDNGGSLQLPGADTMVSPFGGDGGDVIVDPNNAMRNVSEYTENDMWLTTNAGRSDGSTAAWREISPACSAFTYTPDPCDPQPRFIAPFEADPKAPNKHWVSGGRYVWETTDGWRTHCSDTACDWKITHDTGEASQITGIGVNGDTVYVGYCGNGCNPDGDLFYAGIDTNYGGTWHTVAGPDVVNGGDPLPQRYVFNMVVDPADDGHVYAIYSGYSRRWIPGAGVGHVFESTDGGANWNDISGNLPDAPADDLVISGSKLVLATDVGVFTTSAGAPGTWMRYGSGLPNAIPNDLTTTPGGAIVAVTHGRGMFKIAAP